MKRKFKILVCVMLVLSMMFSVSVSSFAAQKYVGMQYLAWFDANTPWDATWGLDSNSLNLEGGSYNGFTLTGTAFGSTPRSTGHGSLIGWEGSYWADSITGGESATGALKSDTFKVLCNNFKFKAAGFDGQSGNKNQNYYYLKRASDNAVLFSSKPPQSDTFTWVQWNTTSLKGIDVYFEVVDNCTDSGYAWLAVDATLPLVPTLGRYNSDYNTGLSHAQTLKGMGVDFIMIDSTNNTIWGPGHPQTQWQVDYIYNNAKEIYRGFGDVSGAPKITMLLSITSWDSDTTQVQRLLTENMDTGTPYMYYPWIPSNCGDLFLNKVSMVYNDMAANSSKYFYYEGKPLLYFYVAGAGTVYDKNGVDRTPEGKLPDTWNPVIPNTSGKTLRELFTVRWASAGLSGSNNPKLVPSSGDITKAYNGHYSWEEGTLQAWAARTNYWGDTAEGITVNPYYRWPTITGRNNGNTFNTQWNRAYDVDPIMTIIHSWNEFSSGDEPSPENSQSIEPTTGYYTDTYKVLAQDYITQFKKTRMDIGLYDTTSRVINLKNRRNDYGSYTLDFGFTSTYSMDRGSGVEALSGDFNGDGKNDFALRNIADGTVAIRYSPYFTPEATGGMPAEKIVSLEAGSRYKAFVGDFNGDGKSDIGFYDSAGGVEEQDSL